MRRGGDTIPRLVRAAAGTFAGREAVVDGDVTLTFAELGSRIEDSARATIAAGIEPGDRVAVWAPNMHEWILAALGAVSAGGVLVPINTRFKGHEAGYVLAKSRARLLFTVRGFLDIDYVALLEGAHGGPKDGRPIDELPHLERIVVLRDASWDAFLHEGEHVGYDEAKMRSDRVEANDLSDIIFTSGTTGRPKGVMTTHEQTVRVFRVWSDVVGLAEGDRYLIVNPLDRKSVV